MTTDEIETVHVEENMTSEEESDGRLISRKNLDYNCKSRNIHRRPNAGDGLWLCTLLPLCLLINCWTHPKSSSLLYKVCSFISFGLFLQSVDILVKLSCKKVNIILNVVTKVIPGIISSLLIWYMLNIKILLSFACGIFSCLFFNLMYLYILKRFSRSFSLGEATIVTQGLIIFLFGASVKISTCLYEPPISKMEEMSAILAVSLLGVLLLIFIVHGISFFRKPIIFSLLLTLWILLSGFTPVTNPLPAVLVGMFIFLDVGRVSVLLIYAGIAGVTGAFVAWKISKKSSTNVSLRKVFHIVIVIVYSIGILFQCTMLFLASGLVLALFIIFETLRLVNFPLIGQHLEAIVKAFVDEKDAGVVAFTPIYLLVGCSLPLWLHPSPCDLTDSTTFTLLPLISGVISVGIGDTMAGIVGSNFGRHRLVNSEKTVEGTVANIISQIATIFFLHFVGFLELNLNTIIISFVGVTVNALLEAKTDQVDNLFLPLVTFFIFSLRV